MAISTYKISIPDSALESLKQRFSFTQLPDELDDAGWDMGAPLADIRRLIDYWKDGFDWRKIEAEINHEVPQFRTLIQVDGFKALNIHFVHQKSNVEGAIPLLFCHGWPGSFLEVRQLVSLLTTSSDKDAVVFDIVAPSLPNFAFSEGSKKRGFALKQYAETCHKLMLKLGYTQYVTQGGDWGFHVTRALALLYPNHCKANHLNGAEARLPSFRKSPLLYLTYLFTPYTAPERAGLARSADFEINGMGYEIQQRTKPQTLSYGLADSPVALLAWLYEKLVIWTDNYPWTDDEILTWVSVYWFSTAGVAANLRIYHELWNADPKDDNGLHYTKCHEYIPHVKLGVLQSPKDLTLQPRSWVAGLGDLVLFTREEHGGHFAATEHPEFVARELRKMFGRGGGAYGCVEGKDGYGKSV